LFFRRQIPGEAAKPGHVDGAHLLADNDTARSSAEESGESRTTECCSSAARITVVVSAVDEHQ
jgi:hypothetical protein